METLLLVNPRKRRAARSRKARSPAQKAATRRMLAANRSRRGPKRHARRAAPAYAPNPIKRRRHASLVKRHTSHKRRRNPIGGRALGLHMSSITALLKTAALGAGGAVVTDVAYGYVKGYLPAMVQSPVAADGSISYAYYLSKGAAAVGLGILLKKIIGAGKAGRMVEGSLTVTLHDLAKAVVGSNFTSVQMGTLSPGKITGQLPLARTLHGVKGMGAYLSGTGAYLSGNASSAMRSREAMTH